MPALTARSASNWPTRFAFAVLSPAAERMVSSRVDAATIVRPAVSSTNWATMWRAERLMTRRGRAAPPLTLLRTRRWRRVRAAVRADVRLPERCLRVMPPAILLPSLSNLAADLLALVPHALALVWIGLAELAYVGRDLADLLLVDSLYRQPGGCLDRELDPVRRLDRDRVAEAEG